MMFGDAITWALEQLHAAGINAASDPADLNTPGVWVVPAKATSPTLGDALDEVTLTLYLVAASIHGPDAIAHLDALAAQVHQVIRLRTLDAVQVSLPNHHPAGLPAYKTTITVHVTKEVNQ